MPGAVATAAYRIVQESLTNVIRHADATHASGAGCASGADAVSGRGPRRRHGGGAATLERTVLGIPGMRERAESTGGRLRAGPAPGGGFVVTGRCGTGRP